MNQMMAYCGIMCDECKAYKATMENDNELRKITAKQWSKINKTGYQPEQINCKGCRSQDRFIYCESCEIRSCCIEKQLDHCGDCSSFPCNKVKTIADNVPGVKERLKAFKK